MRLYFTRSGRPWGDEGLAAAAERYAHDVSFRDPRTYDLLSFLRETHYRIAGVAMPDTERTAPAPSDYGERGNCGCGCVQVVDASDDDAIARALLGDLYDGMVQRRAERAARRIVEPPAPAPTPSAPR